MTETRTHAARTINGRAYREARAAGLPPVVAAYAARPPVLVLDWCADYEISPAGDSAAFDLDGRTFRAEAIDPRAVEGSCIGCAELVDAYNRQDEGYAWITPDEYDAMTHAALTVHAVDEAGHELGTASLWGVCSLDRTPTERRMAERYTAETVADLAREAAALADDAAARSAQRRAEKVATAQAAYLDAARACD